MADIEYEKWERYPFLAMSICNFSLQYVNLDSVGEIKTSIIVPFSVGDIVQAQFGHTEHFDKGKWRVRIWKHDLEFSLVKTDFFKLFAITQKREVFDND